MAGNNDKILQNRIKQLVNLHRGTGLTRTDGGFYSNHKTGIENIQIVMSEVCMANVQVTEMSE